MLFEIQVTQKDIEKGEVYACQNCPVALAFQRATGFHNLYVGQTHFYADEPFSGSKKIRSRRLPESVIDKIAEFDDGECMDPFTFTIEIPDEWLK